MAKIPFNVSARAAMLIGRENIANSKGAVIELVKNCYDADSPFCIIYVDNFLSVLQKQLTQQQYDRAIKNGIDPLYFKKLYTKSEQTFNIKPQISKRCLSAFETRIKKLTALYIIDVGDGMSQETIQTNWMTIGTDNKLHSFITEKGRVKSGAKGIGRFALDKLGSECSMITIPKPTKNLSELDEGSIWNVNWRDFEGTHKNINDVTADFGTLNQTNLIQATLNSEYNFNLIRIWEQLKKLNNQDDLRSLESYSTFSHGTVLKVSQPNDDWNIGLVKQVFEDLEILVPPKDIADFRIFLLSSLEPNEYGEILGPEYDDFDYKIEAHASDDQLVELTVYREEFNTEKMPSDFFKRESVKKNIFEFPQKKWTKTYSFSELLSGYKNPDKEVIFSQIGSFDFNFYFLKRSTNVKDSKRFFYKDIPDSKRKNWLKQFAGIKIYRDNFRVRPYGEVREAAFDWLGLGLRQAASPAGSAKIDGGYKVRPENVAGAIKISRLTNLEFADKSSREGLQETKSFKIFKQIIIQIIAKFEEDRSSIAKELSAYDKEQRTSSFDSSDFGEDQELIVKRIIERERNSSSGQSKPLQASQHEVSILARFADKQMEENERLIKEQNLLRGMASSGIVAASFGHDLSKTKSSLGTRFDELTKLLSPKVTANDFQLVPEYLNPFVFIKEMQKEDRDISMWLSFSLGFARKDKRKRKQIYLDQFFKSMQKNWYETLSDRGITFSIDCPDNLKMRIFEIDFDSIFLNLIVNSIEAFRSYSAQTARQINIKCTDEVDCISIEYKDTGPGLPNHLNNPDIVFEPMYTDKRNSDGEEIGTGLGMWIVKAISDEYQANVRLLHGSDVKGFGLNFSFPHKYKCKD